MISLVCFNEFAEGYGFPSMKESISLQKYENQDKIVKHLHNGTPTMATAAYSVDVFTGERIPQPKVYMNDGKFSWTNILAYYVEHHNLRLPKEFEEHVLKNV